jgi:zinc transporter ZupT
MLKEFQPSSIGQRCSSWPSLFAISREGLAVGVVFGGVAAGIASATLAGAIALIIGIGIQNFPEGLAISMPLRREGFSRARSFWYGQMSALVEPVMAVIGVSVVFFARPPFPTPWPSLPVPWFLL